jgi:outer membrane protein assembly factor BamB
MTSAAMPQRYGALTALVTGFQSTIRSRNGGQEMDTNKQLQKRPWIIEGLLILALLSTAMTGCRNRAASSTVNSTFVDVNGLLTAPTKVATSYPTEELNMGNDNSAGIPQFLDGTLYTFSYHSDLSQWTTAWDQATGKKLWSVATNASVYMPPYTTFTTDGKYLFFVRTDLFKSGEPGVVASIACLDKTTGATLWQRTPTVASPFVFAVHSNIAVHINEQSHTADRVYVIAEEERTSTSVPTTEEMRYLGIWTWDATTGASLDRIDWTTLPIDSETSGQLLCDGATLYAGILESVSPTSRSALMALNCDTNKTLWTEHVNGEATDLIKQGEMLVVPVSSINQGLSINVWKIGAGSFDKTERLWTRQIIMNPPNLAVDSTHVYLQNSNGVLLALDLATGKEVWSSSLHHTKCTTIAGVILRHCMTCTRI